MNEVKDFNITKSEEDTSAYADYVGSSIMLGIALTSILWDIILIPMVPSTHCLVLAQIQSRKTPCRTLQSGVSMVCDRMSMDISRAFGHSCRYTGRDRKRKNTDPRGKSSPFRFWNSCSELCSCSLHVAASWLACNMD